MLSPEETAQLVRSALAGHREAFDALVRAHLRAAYATALAFVQRPADAEDIAQIAMVTAFEKLETCREHQHFRAWLLQIVRNRARNWLEERRLRDVSRNDPENDALESSVVQPSTLDRRQLLAALSVLSELRREIVLLHDLEGWTHGEIAENLGMSEEMSRQHLFLARRELREKLDSQGGGKWKRVASI